MPNLIVITGGEGYLGKALTTALHNRGFVVASLSRSSEDFPCNVSKREEIEAALHKATHFFGAIYGVIHAASPKIERVPEERATDTSHYDVALSGTQNLYEASKQHLAPGAPFIAITTTATGGNYGHYVKAKRAMEKYLEDKNARIFPVGFLPGGLNDDLPVLAKDFFASKSESLESVATRLSDLIPTPINYQHYSRIR